MTITTLKTMLLVGAAAFSIQAQAAFVSTDWKAQGDSRATLHEETGIEWLKLPETSGMSINEVISQLDTTFAGWRLPTKAEVTTMLSASWGINLPQTSWSSTAYNPNITTHHNRLGASFVNTPGAPNAVHTWAYTQTYAMYLDDAGLVNYSGAYYPGGTTTHAYSNTLVSGGTNPDYKLYAYSVYLVSDGGTTLSSVNDPSLNVNNPSAPVNNADVNAPATMSALMLSLGLLMRRRK